MAENDQLVPLAVMDESVGSQIRVLMKDEKELIGVLLGFDDFLNLSLKDVDEFQDNMKVNHVDQMVLNGANIVALLPKI